MLFSKVPLAAKPRILPYFAKFCFNHYSNQKSRCTFKKKKKKKKKKKRPMKDIRYIPTFEYDEKQMQVRKKKKEKKKKKDIPGKTIYNS